MVVAGRRLGPGRIEGESLQVLPFERNARTLSWPAPSGQWLVITYSLEPSQTPDGGTVDLMNPDAVRNFIEIYYEEFHRRYGEYFGNTLPATFADHEGSYGGTIGWTPRLFEAFRRKAGYDLESHLPALAYDVGPKTEKVRCDYLDVVSALYSDSFFKQVTDWCRAHKIDHSGHVWEESLFFDPWVQGDFFRILRAMSNPGCDTLVEWGRQSVWLKEVASVADFEGRRVVCENQGVQGSDSYLSPERMRRVSNCLGAWNVSEFIPHAFDYDLNRINFPPDWFLSQPFLPYFRSYADQMRRISFMNSESHHVADILLYYPQVSVWGQGAPAFRGEGFNDIIDPATWSADAAQTQSQYTELKLRLTENRLDYKVADDSYLAESRLDGKTLVISHSRFHTLVLPPMSTIRHATAERIREFYQAGGTVIAIGRLPLISAEQGRDDERLKKLWDSVFDTSPTLELYPLRSNAAGGRAYFVPTSVAKVVDLLLQISDPDLKILDGSADHLYFLHKKKEGVDFYWVVNDSAEPRTNVLRLHATGRPERWDAQSGKRQGVFYQTDGEHTVVRLALGPWDAAYLVFDPSGPEQSLQLSTTNVDDFVLQPTPAGVAVQARTLIRKEPAFVELREGGQVYRGEYHPTPLAPLELTGNWTVSVGSPTIPQPYAQVRDDPFDRGMKERWFGREDSGPEWQRLWLSPMNWSIRQWNLLGPFPNPGDGGLEKDYPPEHATDYLASYEGDTGRLIKWEAYDAGRERVARDPGSWNFFLVHVEGGLYDPDSFVVNYGKALHADEPLQGAFFAQTNLYASQAQEAVLVLATPSPCAAWVNRRQVYSRWLRPLYNELTDGFAFRIPVKLEAGWNSLLLKFLHDSNNGRAGQFTCRLEDSRGSLIPGLISSLREVPHERTQTSQGFRWLRFPVPPLARALRVPVLKGPWLAFVDGNAAPPDREIAISRGSRTVTLRVEASETLAQSFEFAATPAGMPLGPWNIPGLEHFSGSMTYEKTVDVPAELLTERLLLDCGQVGVAAEAWVNGTYVGARPWQPYVFDVTAPMRPGRNQIKIRVVNTEGNARAVGLSIGNLNAIELNGWVGPARLVPYIERQILCKKTSGV